MKIQQIQPASPVFGVRVVKTQELKDFQTFLYRNSFVGNSQRKDYMHHKNLVDIICKSMRKIPQGADISFTILRDEEKSLGSRGVVSSDFAKFVDTEPAGNDAASPLFSIIKKILHPENKPQLSRLLGEKPGSMEKTESWWNRYISPIWKDIDKYFQETSSFEPSAQVKFNEEFRLQ